MHLLIYIPFFASLLLNSFPEEKQIPVLCYHNIKTSMGQHKYDYTITTAQFLSHMKMLADSGYHTILPGQLYDHLTKGLPLPAKPIIISFDDTREEHYSIAAPILSSHHFKAVFFIMAVCIGKQGYMTEAQIKQLANDGHEVGIHTSDHPDVRKLPATEWDTQVSRPKQTLEQITGKPVLYFAYPYGAWNNAAITALKRRGIKAAFQLSNKQSASEPMFTIRRLIVPGNWTAAALHKQIQASFR